MYVRAREGLEDGFPLSSLGQARLPRLARTPGAAQLLRRHLPFRTSLGQPATVSRNPWPCERPAPKCTTERVSPGGYGTALLWFTDTHCVANAVPRLLKLSPTFMRMVVELDKRYVALDGPSICALEKKGVGWETEWALDAAGVLTRGPFKGRHVLAVWLNAHGSSFAPAGSLDDNPGFDVIFVEPSSDPDIAKATSPRVVAEYIARIAHETTHAFNALTRTGSPFLFPIPFLVEIGRCAPTSIAKRVRAAIADEAATRLTEAKILAEITATAAGSPLRRAIAGLTGSTDTWQIQRDFFPGKMRRTYLEHFVLSERALCAIQEEKLTAAAVDRINGEVDALRLHFTSLRSIKTAYGRFRFMLRGIDARWRGLAQRRGSELHNGDPEKEKLLQEFANHFFGGLAQYDPIPGKP